MRESDFSVWITRFRTASGAVLFSQRYWGVSNLRSALEYVHCITGRYGALPH